MPPAVAWRSSVVRVVTERKPPERHPSTQIPTDTVEEIAYRTYLLRMEPPLTPDESRNKVRTDAAGKIVANDDTRRAHSKSFYPIVRDMLRVLVDMGMVTP